MRIADLLDAKSILLNAAPTSKQEAIDILVTLQGNGGRIADLDEYKRGILEREELGSTAIGEGIAVPHAKSGAVRSPSLAAMTVPAGVDYGALDGEPSYLFFMIAAPNDGDVHLAVLSRLMTMLMDEEFRSELAGAKSAGEFLGIISDMEKKRFAALESDRDETAPGCRTGGESPETGVRFRVLAVTACPTGIAHTYMAAEALERAGARLGIPVKAETNGAGGVGNALTAKEIEECDGIIVAADKTVEMARFDGKKVICTKASDGIKIPEELIKRIAAGDAPVYCHGKATGGVAAAGGVTATGESPAVGGSDGESLGRKIYKHLMNGVSNMLPFTVAGGIFIALAFLIDSIAGAPQDADFGSYTAAAAFFKTVGGYAFEFMIPVLAAYIGKSVADRPGFLVGLAGGALAVSGSTFTAVSGGVPSGFLGALFAGFAGGYIMLGIEKICGRLPAVFGGIRQVLIYPIAGLGMIAVLMCAVNPFMGFINTGLTNMLNSMGDTSRIVLGCVLGAMMSVDMGGPFNKAAYVFGTAAVTTGGYDIMAAVMAGGMVPPLAIALSTTFFKSRWNAEERKNGTVNYIMGLSFITEGAIPYAASAPFRIIPACMVGAAAAGGLSMAFNCTLMAPHGGIFVFAVVGNWPLYLLALAAGSLLGMLMLALLKKKNNEN